jgi:hypothetical protein
MTDRDSFGICAHKSDERPNALSPWFQYRVLLSGREQFPNPPSVIPARRCRSTHNRQ